MEDNTLVLLLAYIIYIIVTAIFLKVINKLKIKYPGDDMVVAVAFFTFCGILFLMGAII